MGQRLSAGQRHLALLGLLLLLASLLTWPLVRHLTTHVPGNGIDDPSLAWNLWWMRARLIDQLNLDIFHVGWMFHPIEINLAFYTLTPLNGLLSIPLQLATNLIVASNALLLSTYIIGGYGAFLFCAQSLGWVIPIEKRDDRALWLAAGLGGVVYAFASAKLFYAALGQFNIASSHWIPFCLIYLHRIHRSLLLQSQPLTRDKQPIKWPWRDILLCGLFLTFQAWAELTYASFLIIFILIYALWLLLKQLFTTRSFAVGNASRLTRSWRVLWPLGLLAILFLLGIAPFLTAMLPDMQREGDFFGSGGGFADVFSADLVGYLLPTRLHPLVGSWVKELHGEGFSNDVGQHIYLGYTLLFLCVVGGYAWIRQRGTKALVGGWFWIVNFIFFWLLTLGPAPRWFGQALPFSGPFALISQLPFFSGNRYPSRYSVMLLICAALLAAHGLYWLLQRMAKSPRRASLHPVIICSLFGLLFLGEHLSIPLPLNRSTTPGIYQQIADEAGDFTILELPTGWRNGAYVLGKSDKLIMMQQWVQSIHGKVRLGGNTSRNPWYKFEYFVNAPLIGDLITLMNADRAHIAPVVNAGLDELIERNRAIAPTVLDFLDIRFVTVRVEKSPPALLRFVDEALPLTLVDEWQGRDWDDEAETIRLYRVDDSDLNDTSSGGLISEGLEMSNPLAALTVAEGWAPLADANGIRYATRPAPTLMVDLPPDAGFLDVEWLGERVELWLNGNQLTPASAPETVGPQRFLTRYRLESGMADAPVDRLTLRFEGYGQLAGQVNQSPDGGWPIGSSGQTLASGNSLLVLSAGEESGKLARIFVNGYNQVDQQRGYNLVALAPTGVVLDAQTFDTIVGGNAAEQMVAWLEGWPTGTIIAGAAADAVDQDGGGQIGERLMSALAEIGLREDVQGRHRWAHAFVGVVDAPPGSALELSQLAGIATLPVGAPVDAPTVLGGVKSLHFMAESSQ